MSDVCQPNRSVVDSRESLSVGEVARVRTLLEPPQGISSTEIAHSPVECSLEKDSLPETTKMMLENKGIYGWWRSLSSSPSPGLVCFSLPQRATTTKSARLKDFHQESGHDYGSPERHEQLCQILRAEEKLAGHRCFCVREGTKQKNSSDHLKALERPYCLLYALFQQACQIGGTGAEGLAYMAHLKRVATESKLGWSLFQFESNQTSFFETPTGPNVFANAKGTPQPSVLRQLQSAAECIGSGIDLLYRKVHPPITTPLDNTLSGANGDSLLSTLGNVSLPSTIRSSKDYLIRMKKWVTKRWDELGRLSTSMWVPPGTIMTEASKARCQLLLNSMNRLEALLIRKSAHLSGPVITTFSDIAPVWLRHLRPSLVDQDILKAIDKPEEVLPLSRAALTRPKPGIEYVLQDLLGFPIDYGLDGIDRPQPLAMTLEAPECSVTHLLCPLQRQIQERLQNLRDAGSGACDDPSFSDSNDQKFSQESCMSSYKPWWKRSDEEEKKAERDHLVELEQEQALLAKCMEAHLGRRPTTSTASVDYAGPLSYEPYQLVSDIYGRRLDMAQFDIVGDRPYQTLGQSKRNLFTKPGPDGPLIKKETLESYFNVNPSDVFQMGSKAAMLADSRNPTESEDLFQQSLFGSRR